MKTKKSTRSKNRYDEKLSPDELNAAIKEYLAKRKGKDVTADGEDEEITGEAFGAKPGFKPAAKPEPKKTDGDDEENPFAKKKAAENQNDDEPEDIEGKVQMLKDRKDRRDAEGEPETKSEALDVIERQDEDIEKLYNIIDTLLAEREFDAADDEEGNKPENSVILGDGDDEEEDDPFAKENEDDEDDFEEDDEDDEDETAEKLDCGKDKCDGDDDDIPTNIGKDVKVNADSIDAVVRKRVKIGLAAEKLNLDGLDSMSIVAAQKRVVRAIKPSMRLDGKSAAYIDAAFNMAYDELKSMGRKSTAYQKRQMFNADSRTAVRGKSEASEAQRRMIARLHKKGDK